MAGQGLGCVLPKGKAPVFTNHRLPWCLLLCQKLPPELSGAGPLKNQLEVETAVKLGPSHRDEPGPGKQEVLGLLKGVPGALQPTPANYTSG